MSKAGVLALNVDVPLIEYVSSTFIYEDNDGFKEFVLQTFVLMILLTDHFMAYPFGTDILYLPALTVVESAQPVVVKIIFVPSGKFSSPIIDASRSACAFPETTTLGAPIGMPAVVV